MHIFEVLAIWMSRVATWATTRRNRRHLAQTHKRAELLLVRISALKRLHEGLVVDNVPRQIVLARMDALDYAVAKWCKRPDAGIVDASRLTTAMLALHCIVRTNYSPKTELRAATLNAMCNGTWRGYTTKTAPNVMDGACVRI
jgi:hypothetical protein